MKDIPMFTTEYGVASLSLKEIPYRHEAYIHIRDTQQPKELLKECVTFCRTCGAEHIYATGHPCLEGYPLHTAVIQMRGTVEAEGIACLWPVTAENAAQWRQIYNEKMTGVATAATLTSTDEHRLAADAGAYFVHDTGDLLGIGWLMDGQLLAIASVKPGEGGRVLQTILSLAEGETVSLEVASTNEKAIRLYEKHGFIKTKELRSWYCVY